MIVCGSYNVESTGSTPLSDLFFCEKDGIKYFIKKYNYIQFPAPDDSGDPAKLREAEARAQRFLDYRIKVLNVVKDGLPGENGSGATVFPIEYYKDPATGKIYSIMRRVNVNNEFGYSLVTRDDKGKKLICELPDKDKLIFMRAAAFSLKKLHSAGVVHMDLKPENIPIVKLDSGSLGAKVTDLDDGDLISGDPPEPDFVMTTEKYMPVETFIYKGIPELAEQMKPHINTSLDVFQMGLVFHEWWTGTVPGCVDAGESFYQKVLSCWPDKLELSPELPDWLADLITKMLAPFDPDTMSLRAARPTMEEVFSVIRRELELIDSPKDEDKKNPPKEEEKKTPPEPTKGYLSSEEAMKMFGYAPVSEIPGFIKSIAVRSDGKIIATAHNGTEITYTPEMALTNGFIVRS